MNIRKKLILFTIFSFSTTASSATPIDETAALEISQRWVEQLNAGKIESISRLYTEDAIMMPPSSEILSKPTDIESYWRMLEGAGVKDYAVYPVALRIDGKTAYQSALWEATRFATDGNHFLMSGNISNVLELQKDGSWKIKMQSWN